MRALVVEDEPALLEQLKQQLSGEGYSVDTADNGEDGLFMGQEYDYDIAILDIGLPKIDGLQVVEKLRQADRNFPILLLTARSNWQDKVSGLNSGADDYLAKPFQFEELTARINALIRRSAGIASPEIRYGRVCLDTIKQLILVNNQVLDVTAFEYKLFEYLLHHPGKVVSKTVLTEHIYAQDFERDSNVIEVFITRLRKKLAEHDCQKCIETVRGRGYRFNQNSLT
jgi:two-component system response regulator PhoP